MSLKLRWVGEADYDRVGEARALSYGVSPREVSNYADGLRMETRGKPGDYLLAEVGSEVAGTAAAYDFTSWVRGSPVPAQGVAFVGTVRTLRRKKMGVASQIMRECLNEARRRGQVFSALMPFRASYYEHFGYGVVERRCEWTIPLSVISHGDFDGIRYAKPEDRPAIAACHHRSVQRGQCDMERNAARWQLMTELAKEGFELVNADGNSVHGFFFYNQFARDGKDFIRVLRHASDDVGAFKKMLHFFASLKDQYHAMQITLPADFPVNWLLTERQLPHRLVNHLYPEVRTITRMQVRILDHEKLVGAMNLPAHVRGQAVVAVHESEGTISKFRVTIEGGRVNVQATDAAAEVTCGDVAWAAVALGELPASNAVRLGLLDASNSRGIEALNALSAGPVPFNEEYF